MKKTAILFLMSFIFMSCEMFQTDIVAFLDKYSNTAAIELVHYGENPIDSNGIEHLSSTGDKVIRFTMRNPKEYDLITTISWEDSVLPDGVEAPIEGPEGGSAIGCTLEQLSSDKSIIELMIYESYLQQVDNAGGAYLSGSIALKEEESLRDFDSFDFTVAINSPPPTPQPVFVKNDVDSPARWYVAFDVATLSQRKTLQGDISAITIDGVNYPINIDESGVITGLNSGFTTTIPPANDGSSPSYSDSLGQAYTHSSGNTVYFDSGHDYNGANDFTSSVQFIDSKGLVSSTVSVSTKAQPIREFYVADAVNGNGKSGNPFNNVQSAVDAIKAINDEESMYTIYIKGTISQQGSANSNGMIVIDSEKPLNISLQNWGGGTATIDASGKNKRVLYISGARTNVTLNGIIITGGRVTGAPAIGGGVYLISGNLTLKEGSEIKDNNAQGTQGSKGSDGRDSDEKDGADGEAGGTGSTGGNAYGGGVYITNGILNLEEGSKIYNNNATGGRGGTGGTGGDAKTSSGSAGIGGYGGTGGNAYGGGVCANDESQLVGKNTETVYENDAIGGAGGTQGTGGRNSNGSKGGSLGPGGGGSGVGDQWHIL